MPKSIKIKSNQEKISNLKFAALVPMKGHSERVPNKNIKDFKRIDSKPILYSMDSLEVADIDTSQDFKLAEALIKVYKVNNGNNY